MKLKAVLTHLSKRQVRFATIGGVALIARGVQRSTEDLDVAYARDRENIRRLATALEPLHPRLRGISPGLPFTLDEASLRNGLNFTLDTDLGPLDLLGEVLSLDGLEATKRAAGRPKDLLDLGYIRALRGV